MENATRVQLALQAESNFNSAAISEKNVILSAADAPEMARRISTLRQTTAATPRRDRPF